MHVHPSLTVPWAFWVQAPFSIFSIFCFVFQFLFLFFHGFFSYFMFLEFPRIFLKIVFFIFFNVSVNILVLASCLWVALRSPSPPFGVVLRFSLLLLRVVQYVSLI